jgi:phosphonate transport system substrate-binding protein
MKVLLKYLAIITLAWAGTICFADNASAARQKIIIAIIPETNLIKQMERFTPLCHYLEVKTGLEVDVRPMSNYGQIYEEMRDGNIDAGFFGSFVYVLTRARIGIEPLVRPVDRNEKSTYTGLTFVRKDSGIRSPADMKGKTIALADPSTTAGYLSQREYLKNNGINIDKDLTIFWTGSHDAAVKAVLLGQAEIGGAKDKIVRKIQKMNRVFDSTAVIIDETPRNGVPDNTFAVRKGLDRKITAKLKKTFLEMRSDPYGKEVLSRFGATRFISTTDDDFKSLYKLVSHLNVDLQSYPYKKDMQSSRTRGTGE